MDVKFKKLHDDAKIPSYAHDTDAGLDLTAVSFTQEFDKSNKLVLVYHTGLAVEIPEGYVGLIFMRSSVNYYLSIRLLQIHFLLFTNQERKLVN